MTSLRLIHLFLVIKPNQLEHEKDLTKMRSGLRFVTKMNSFSSLFCTHLLICFVGQDFDIVRQNP